MLSSDPREFYAPYASACYRYLAEEFSSVSTITSPEGRILPFESFILHVLTRGGFPPDLACLALFLLHRVKSQQPYATAKDGSPLFIAALLLAEKSVADHGHHLNSWAEMSQFTMTKRLINSYERELLQVLQYNIHINPSQIEGFGHFKRVVGWPSQASDAVQKVLPHVPASLIARPSSVLHAAHEAYTKTPAIESPEHACASPIMGRAYSPVKGAAMDRISSSTRPFETIRLTRTHSTPIVPVVRPRISSRPTLPPLSRPPIFSPDSPLDATIPEYLHLI
ncbi:hypothetical protein OE88DRAFT_1665966 [Heliocybe sulcata]|uniref:Cyclin N-terminal domain-containing protein n=1 Tax=Heliocybe sulcata TaxID=5364 RepID=A0A5C3MR07_9AGAM|nr:hypothetical protein OE88DRAFT_1665966 [Heliocybe sulcata]